MVKLIVVLLLVACVTRLSGPWMTGFDGQKILCASEENNKSSVFEFKEKQEQEQAFPESVCLFAGDRALQVQLQVDGYQYFPVHHNEPSSPPPNAVHF